MANAGSFKKGEKRPNQGKRGKNKENKALREMILEALHGQDGGGIEYLKAQAQSNPTAFLTLLGKVLPTTLAGTADDGAIVHRVELVALSGDSAD